MKFFRENPQLWMTALVGLCIILSFLFIAWRFARIANNAQEELVNVRAGTILDTFVVLVPDILENQELLRERMTAIYTDNPTVDSLTIFAQHGDDAWRVYTSVSGPREGTVLEDMLYVFNFALTDPDNAFTFESTHSGERRFTTARAITNEAGVPVAIVVAEQGMAKADEQITYSIQTSVYILLALLVIISILFFRHARIVDFAVLYKKQLEVDKMKDSFISMASHELKSPLSVIRGYIEFLKDGDVAEEKKFEYLRRIDVSAEELRLLVDDILDVSRIDMGRIRFGPEYVTVFHLLTDVHGMFSNKAEEKELQFTINAPEEVHDVKIRVDKSRFKQSLVNLVSNAIKYTNEGTVTLGMKVKDEVVEIVVEDSGIGLTAEEQKKLFTKFYRAQAEESEGVSGTGLGLWITKYITEHMNGSISVESVKGKGSRFILRFPLFIEEQNDEDDTTQ